MESSVKNDATVLHQPVTFNRRNVCEAQFDCWSLSWSYCFRNWLCNRLNSWTFLTHSCCMAAEELRGYFYQMLYMRKFHLAYLVFKNRNILKFYDYYRSYLFILKWAMLVLLLRWHENTCVFTTPSTVSVAICALISLPASHMPLRTACWRKVLFNNCNRNVC